MDYVYGTYDIPMIEDYLNPDGVFDILDWFGGTSIYVFSDCHCLLVNCKINTSKLENKL